MFVELNADFVPNHHVDQDENLRKLGEQLASDCNLVLMNCSMDATTGPGLISFFSENAYKLVRQFKEEKQKDLALLRAKQQGANESSIVIEDLIADSDDQSSFEQFGDDLNGKLGELLHRKLSNAFSTEEAAGIPDEENLVDNRRESAANLQELIATNDQQSDAEQPSSRALQFDHKLPFYASTSELLDENSVGISRVFEESAEHSFAHSLSHSRNASRLEANLEFEMTQRKRSKSHTQEFESSLSSTSDD